MIWENSLYLWFLLLIPILWGAFWAFGRYQKKKTEKLFDERLINSLRKNYWSRGDKIRLGCFLAAMFFFIVALAGPKIGTEIREVEQSGVNMLIALDLSRSMNAEDVPPSRLEKAKLEINRLVDRLEGDRVGLIVFTGEAYVQSPITQDYSALRLFLDIVQTEQMPSSTTDFQRAFLKAEETFDSIRDDNNAANVLLFIADGENHGPDFMPVLQRLTDDGVRTFSIGIGTEAGGQIPIYENGNHVGYHRDSDGEQVVTRLSSETMRQIASFGGGNYYQINSGSDTIEPFLSRLEELERGEFSTEEFADYKNRYQLLLLTGLIFFISALLFPDFTFREEKKATAE